MKCKIFSSLTLALMMSVIQVSPSFSGSGGVFVDSDVNCDDTIRQDNLIFASDLNLAGVWVNNPNNKLPSTVDVTIYHQGIPLRVLSGLSLISCGPSNPKWSYVSSLDWSSIVSAGVDGVYKVKVTGINGGPAIGSDSFKVTFVE